MRHVGSVENIDLFAPTDAYLSFFNSPYTGHLQGSAIDIYPSHGQWNGAVSSPVSGRITNIKRMRMGRAKEFPTEDFDYAIGIAPNSRSHRVVRVMHCNPDVSVGETVDSGDNIGTAARSRYFNYWTGPHYHVEVVEAENFYRASKSFPLMTKIGQVTRNPALKARTHNAYHVEVLRATKDNVVVGNPLETANSPNYSGLAALSEDGICGILDAGVSHYIHGGIITADEIREGSKVQFHNTEIGEVDFSNADLHHFKRDQVLEYILNDERIRGLSSFLYPKSAYQRKRIPLVLVPLAYGQFQHLQEGDSAELQINTIKGN